MKVFASCEFLKKENGASAKRYLNYLRQQNNTSTLPAQIINKFTFDSCLPILDCQKYFSATQFSDKEFINRKRKKKQGEHFPRRRKTF